MKLFIYSLLLILMVSSCKPDTPVDHTIEDTSRGNKIKVDRKNINKTVSVISENLKAHKVYVPIYSDIYQRSRNENINLTATLSIRNTSELDSIFLNRVDYFNTKGQLVRQYVEAPTYLKPLETLEYIIYENDNTGGSGANYIIEWYGKENLTPVFQAVMIGGLGSKSFSFVTSGSEVIE